MPKYLGYFELTGNFDPDEITRLLDLEPSWIHRKGGLLYDDSHGPSTISVWALYCFPDAGGELSTQLVYLLSVLWPKREIVKTLCSESGKASPTPYLRRVSGVRIHLRP
jgi:hypothetical protein